MKPTYDELEQMISMQAEALKRAEPHLYAHTGRAWVEQALSATSETVAAWRAKETEPLSREVATLVAWVKLSADGGYWTGLDDVEEAAKNLVEKMQATALAYEREVKAKTLEDAAEQADFKFGSYARRLKEMAAELRANKGE